ncbi:polysaccharide biosynthesis family protein, partial [Vibrio parahaemolyticus V-223/04]
ACFPFRDDLCFCAQRGCSNTGNGHDHELLAKNLP